MSHEELLDRDVAGRRAGRDAVGPAATLELGEVPLTVAPRAEDHDLENHDPQNQDPQDGDAEPAGEGPHEGPAPGTARGRRIALAAAATALLALIVAAAGHEIAVRRDVAALERSRISVEAARVDLRPLLYARLAGSRLTANVPLQVRVVNAGDRPVRVVALQVGGVSVAPVENALVPAGGRATLNALARMTCDALPARAAPGLAVLPDGQAQALLADADGRRRALRLTGWPALDQRLPTASPCPRFTWAGPSPSP